MEILVERLWKKPTYTIGNLSINGTFFCNTLEDTDRGLSSDMSVSEIQKIKIAGQTAIPTGRYQIIETNSPKFNREMPLLLNVKGFSAIRIHPGNSNKDTEGCILVGENLAQGRVYNSLRKFNALSQKIHDAIFNGYKIWITIK